jgi:hypothetical protein
LRSWHDCGTIERRFGRLWAGSLDWRRPSGRPRWPQLLILAGLRRLEETVEREARKMPVHIDILANKVLGREFKRGLQEGRQEGRQEGELTVLSRLIERRFGAVPAWAAERLAGLSTAELEELSERILEARSIEDLLR